MPVRNKRADQIEEGDVVLDRAGVPHTVTRTEISFGEGITLHFDNVPARTFRVSDKLPVRS